jgi:hypothetical protein
LNQIFEQSKTKIGGMAKMVYINCLMYHFESLDASQENAQSFDIYDVELDYAKYERHFVELHKAGLIQIREKSIHFINHWGQLINRTELDAPNPDRYVGDLPYHGINQYEERMKTSAILIEQCQRQHKLSKQQVENALNDFIQEQIAITKTYIDYQACSQHFYFWLGKKAQIIKSSKPASSNNILGL